MQCEDPLTSCTTTCQYDQLPLDLHYKILSFLEVKEIYLTVSRVSMSINNILQNTYFQDGLIRQLLPRKIIVQLNAENRRKILQRLIDQSELPIWGYKSTGGCTLSYQDGWIHKAFMENKDPVVTFQLTQGPFYFDGVITLMADVFKLTLQKIAYFSHRFLGKEEIDCMRDLCIRSVYNDTFRIVQTHSHRNSQWRDIFLQENLVLWEITTGLNNIRRNGFTLVDQCSSNLWSKIDATKLHRLGAVRHVKFAINNNCNQKPKTVLVYTSVVCEPIPDCAEIFKTEKDVAEYAHRFPFKVITRTNIPMFQPFAEHYSLCTKDEVQSNKQSQPYYCIFLQMGLISPLIWIYFKPSTCYLNQELATNYWHIFSQIRVYVVDTQETGNSAMMGTGISYFSFHGPRLWPLNVTFR